MAGTAYKILMSLSHQPAAKTNLGYQTSTPTLNLQFTGETENGMSIMVVRMDLPRKLNFATDSSRDTKHPRSAVRQWQAVSKVSLTADKVIWMHQSLAITHLDLGLNASTNTKIKGNNKQLKKKLRQMLIKVRYPYRSRVASRDCNLVC